jgi:hypothetical protein
VPTRVTLIADYSRDSKTPWNETVPSLENLFFSRSRKMCLQVFVLSREEFNTTRISGVLGVKKRLYMDAQTRRNKRKGSV